MADPKTITLSDWEFVDLSFGCPFHNAATCLLLRNKHNGRELHFPGQDPADG